MSLSDREIKELIEKADSLNSTANKDDTSESNGIRYLKEALECYGKLIECVPNRPYYYAQRFKIEYELACREVSFNSAIGYFKSSIDDINKAIELEPDKGENYYHRGFYYFSKLSSQEDIGGQLSGRIIKDYHTCVSKDPTQPKAWLGLLSINLILGNYDEAISIYGQCKPYIDSKNNQLIRAWFGCVTFVLAGDSIEDEDIRHFSSVPS